MEYAKREGCYIANLQLLEENNLFGKRERIYWEALIYNG